MEAPSDKPLMRVFCSSACLLTWAGSLQWLRADPERRAYPQAFQLGSWRANLIQLGSPPAVPPP